MEARHLIEQAEEKIRKLSELLDLVTERMKQVILLLLFRKNLLYKDWLFLQKIDNVETDLNAKIDILYENMVNKAVFLRDNMKSLVSVNIFIFFSV